MTLHPGPDESASELWIQVADVAAAYGDPGNKYATFINAGDPLFSESPYFFWDQPLSNMGFVANSSDGPAPLSSTTEVSIKAVPTSGGLRLISFPVQVLGVGVFAVALSLL